MVCLRHHPSPGHFSTVGKRSPRLENTHPVLDCIGVWRLQLSANYWRHNIQADWATRSLKHLPQQCFCNPKYYALPRAEQHNIPVQQKRILTDPELPHCLYNRSSDPIALSTRSPQKIQDGSVGSLEMLIDRDELRLKEDQAERRPSRELRGA